MRFPAPRWQKTTVYPGPETQSPPWIEVPEVPFSCSSPVFHETKYLPFVVVKFRCSREKT